MKSKNIYNGGKHPILWHGKWIKPGERWNHQYGKYVEEKWTRLDQEEKVQIKEDKGSQVEKRRKELAAMEFKDLRELGYKYGQKDTSKDGLIEEIIAEQVKRGEL